MLTSGTLFDLTTQVLPLIQAAAIVIARPLGFVLGFPPFSWMGLTPVLRSVTALVIGVPYIGFVYGQLVGFVDPIPVEILAIIAVKEFLIGLLLAVVFGSPFWAAEMAGGYVDVFRGNSVATVASPDQMSEPLVTGALLSLTMAAIFIAMGGLRIVIGAIYETYEIWPFFELLPEFGEPIGAVVLALLAKIALLALALGAPLLLAMFLGEVALAYASRAAAQINVFDATLSIKNLIYLLLLPPYIYLLTTQFAQDAFDLDGFLAIIARLGAQP